jgi:hypothetical protein
MVVCVDQARQYDAIGGVRFGEIGPWMAVNYLRWITCAEAYDHASATGYPSRGMDFAFGIHGHQGRGVCE